MDTELLKTFLEVSRTRHFGRAAESLYLTQSAVSFRIRQLENQLGTDLFTRHRNNIRLTAAGERLLPYAENLMETWQLAKQEVTRTVQNSQLSIGASAALWEICLTPWLQALYQQRETLQLEARVAPRQTLVKQLHERQLDLLITTETPKMDEFTSQLLGHFSLQLFCATETEVGTEMPYIRVEWGADFYQQERHALLSNATPILTTTSAQLARQLLGITGGYAFLPCRWEEHQPQLKRCSEMPPITRPIYAVWLQNSDPLLLIRQLLKIPLITAR